MGGILARRRRWGLAAGLALTPAGDGVDLTLTNDLGGYLPEGFDGWAAKADAMLAEQLGRLKRYVETGAPAPAK